MIPKYNRVAFLYDRLAQLVFGNRLELAKKAHLDLLGTDYKVLVVGGGTGSLLKYIEEASIKCYVDFIEVSSQMMRRAGLTRSLGL